MDGGRGLEGERRRRRVAIPTCLLLSLLGGRRLGAARTWSLSVVSGLLSVILRPGGAVVWLGSWGCSGTPSSGHLRCRWRRVSGCGRTGHLSPTAPPSPLVPAHLASCSTPPRPLCSLAVGALRAAGAAGLWGPSEVRGCPSWGTGATPAALQTHLSFCNTLPRP